MANDDQADEAPSGFRILHPDEPFEVHAGPHYFAERDGELIAGFRARSLHANSGGPVHGGALTAFADSALTGIALHALDTDEHWIATVTLNCEFVAPAQVGDWIECQGHVTRVTRTMVFVRGELSAGTRTIMTCSTVLKRVRPASQS